LSTKLTIDQLKVEIGEPVLTRYERARIVGARALQISHGAPVLIETDNTDFRPHDVANKELKARVLPIGLSRRLPNGKSQVIPLFWLKDREFITQIDIPEEEITISPRKEKVPEKEVKKPAKKSKAKSEPSKNSDITQIKGIGAKKVDEYHEVGFTSVDAIANADPKDLQKVSGVGPATAKKIIESAKELL
jgi:DNA-directed RNA polymerase subunit K/omega